LFFFGMMMGAIMLQDDQWERMREFVPGGRKGKRGPRSDARKFIDGLLWLAGSGGGWQDLPEQYGPYQAVKRRYYRWLRQGIIERIFEAVSDNAEMGRLAADARRLRAELLADEGKLKKGALKPRLSPAPAPLLPQSKIGTA
jgi:transposase